MKRRWAFAATAWHLAAAGAGAQTVLFVNIAQTTGAGNGSSWADAFRGEGALQQALDAAGALQPGSDAQLWVAAGSYTPTRPTIAGESGSVTFQLLSRVALYGGFAGTETQLSQRDPVANVTTLSGIVASGRAWHVVTTSGVDATCLLDGFTLSSGLAVYIPGVATRGGAGLLNVGGSPLVRNCTIAGNRSLPGYGQWLHGGGACCEGGSPRFEGCRFTSNSAGPGGGLWGSATLVGCAFEDNSASGSYGDGGAVNGDCTIESCTFISNSAKFGGGAIAGSADIEDSLFQENAAFGGAALSYGPFTVRRSVFRANDAADDDGVAYLFDPSTFDRCTFEQNSASYNSTVSGPALLLSACRFSGHQANEYYLWLGNGSAALSCIFRGNRGSVIAGGNTSIVNCTFAANTGPGAVRTGGAAGNNAVANCIFWGNTSGGVPTQAAQINATPGAVDVNYCCIQGLDGSLGGAGNFADDPRLDPDSRLLPPSPCIDSGLAGALPAGASADAFGQPRAVDDPGMPNTGAGLPPVDIGAFEHQGTSCYPNCDGSANAPVLSVSDFTCFLCAFAASSPLANCDGSTTPPGLNVADFTCFLQRFAAGCP